VNWEVTRNSCVGGESGERSSELREKPRLFGRCGMVCWPGRSTGTAACDDVINVSGMSCGCHISHRDLTAWSADVEEKKGVEFLDFARIVRSTHQQGLGHTCFSGHPKFEVLSNEESRREVTLRFLDGRELKYTRRLVESSIDGGCHNDSCRGKNRVGSGRRLFGDDGCGEGCAGDSLLRLERKEIFLKDRLSGRKSRAYRLVIV